MLQIWGKGLIHGYEVIHFVVAYLDSSFVLLDFLKKSKYIGKIV